ncbi:MAG: phosphomannomutase/phosphoglucomutase [Methylotetracoccus sp.]
MNPDCPIDPAIFRAYDIRGVVGTSLDARAVELIGRAIGSEATARGQQRMVVARDGRLSSPSLAAALTVGLRASGRDVIDLGLCPTPAMYFATHAFGTRSGVIVTASHNPADQNGLKIVLDGETLCGDAIQDLARRIGRSDFVIGHGALESADPLPAYIERIVSDIDLARRMRIVIDCGNGVAGIVARRLFEALGCETLVLFEEVDGRFPHHHPDPSRPDNLASLIREVSDRQADLGLAFDGDGDRLGVVDASGTIIWPDRLLMLFAIDVLSRHPGADILFDIKCSRHMPQLIVAHGGRPLMWKSGHSLMKAKLAETGAPLGGERSGHIFFADRWYGFDDGLYAGARLLELLSRDCRTSTEVFEDLPNSANTPEISLPLPEGESIRVAEQLRQAAEFPDAVITGIDGLRVDFADGFFLARASNTSSALILRFEGDDRAALDRVRQRFDELLHRVRPDLDAPAS